MFTTGISAPRTARTVVACAVLLFILTSSRTLAQGYYWESTISGGPVTKHVVKNYMMPKMFKMEQTGDKGETIVTDLTKKIVLRINDADKTYSVLTLDELAARMKAMGSDTDAKMAELREKMKDMPEEQRKMMEKMMGPMAGSGGAIEVKKGAEKKTIAGFACTKYEVVQNDRTIMTVWSTRDLKGFAALRSDWEEFSRRMTDGMPGTMGKAVAEGMKKIDGFPMETEIGPVVSTVTKIEQRATPASAFAAPEGYTKADEPMLQKKQD